MDRLQWGNRKRLRCVKVKVSDKQTTTSSPSPLLVNHLHKPTQSLNRDLGSNDTRKSPDKEKEKEDRYYTTRGSGSGVSNKLFVEEMGAAAAEEDKDKETSSSRLVWPKLFVALSNKEKEEDFMAMKGCKLPQRPKKRAKLVQKSLLLVSPGAWLSELCQERYQVREKKTSKKRPRARGLKAMGTMETDSE